MRTIGCRATTLLIYTYNYNLFRVIKLKYVYLAENINFQQEQTYDMKGCLDQIYVRAWRNKQLLQQIANKLNLQLRVFELIYVALSKSVYMQNLTRAHQCSYTIQKVVILIQHFAIVDPLAQCHHTTHLSNSQPQILLCLAMSV